MKFRRITTVFSFSMLILLILSACQTAQPEPQNTAQPTEALPTLVSDTPTPTVVPERSLVICSGEEPQTLFLYGSDSKGMWSVLEAIYDGPFDQINFEPQPVILERNPLIGNEDVIVEAVTVKTGDEIVDADGNVAVLLEGVRVKPAGCQDSSCIQTWDGQSELLMDQQTISFRMLTGLLWSDGEPLTAADSVFSFQIANDPALNVNRYYLDRTAAYTASDDTTVTWQSIPGFVTTHTSDPFWVPLPQHQLQGLSAQEMLTDPMTTRQPLGWGAYQITDWVFGDHLTLEKNPNYFRAAEGLPYFDSLVFRFLGPNADNNLKALEIGECDLIDSTVELDQQLVDVVEGSNLNNLQAYFGQGPEWEHLDFGIVPASYDDGYQPGIDRPDFFGDLRMRQAIAYCTDRDSVADKYFVNRSSVPTSFYAPSHPAFDDSLMALPYDVEKGSALLTEIGWLDSDNDPNTPRIANGVNGVPNGTELRLHYVTSQAELRQLTSFDLAKSMGACGISIDLEFLYAEQLYAPGPEGLMFGRNFELAQFAWMAGRDSPCYLYTSQQIPDADNQWVGVNVSGYQNTNFDQACQAALSVSPETPELYMDTQAEVQQIFNTDLPVLPLYYHLKTAASRVDFCGFDHLDVSARSALWNIESFNYGANCQP